MSDNDASECGIICLVVILLIFIPSVVLSILYTDPNPPELSIVEFSVPAFNKTSNETIGDIYFDLKIRNMNKAISLYYVDPFGIAISYYPLEDPYQKYVWEYALPPFFQGNGKTTHIRKLIGQPSKVDVRKQDNTITGGKVVTFKIDMLVSYKFNNYVNNDVNKTEAVGEVAIDANTGERISKGAVKLETLPSPQLRGQAWIIELFED